MVKLSKGQIVRTEFEGKWWISQVLIGEFYCTVHYVIIVNCHTVFSILEFGKQCDPYTCLMFSRLLKLTDHW